MLLPTTAETEKVVMALQDAVVAYLQADGEVAKAITNAIGYLRRLDAHFHDPKAHMLTWQGRPIGIFWKEETAKQTIDHLMNFGVVNYQREEFRLELVTIQGPPK